MSSKDEPKERPEKVADPIISQIGVFGWYQFWFCFLVFLCKFGTGWHTLAHIFLAAPATVSCTNPSNVSDPCDDDCEEFEFDRSVFKSTIIMEWNLVCKYKNFASMSQSIVMAGIMFGSILFGIWSDKWGRRPAFLGCCFMQLITGLIVIVSPAFWFYCVFRFLVAFATGGTMTTSFVLIMELIGPKYRELISITYQLPFNVGHASLALFAYFIRDWRMFQLSVTVFSFIYIIYICLIPESPRWLFVTGRLDKAIAILEKIAKRNKYETTQIRGEIEVGYAALSARTPTKKGNITDLFRTPYLCLKTVCMSFDWMVVCMVYYGVGQYISKMSGNIFLNVGVSATLGIFGTLLCVVLTIVMGRKWTLLLSNGLSGIALLTIAAFTNMSAGMQVVCAAFALFGASVTFPNVYLYGGELFPTVVRSTGVGFCSFLGRVGSIIAPFISDLSSNTAAFLTPMIFGIFSIVAVIGTCFLPETRGMPLPETLEDGETFGRKGKKTES